MTKEDVLNLIDREIAKHGNQKNFCDALGIDQPSISQTLKGKRVISKKILAYLGIEEIKTKKYRRIKNA